MLSTDKSKKTELAATPAPMARKIKLPIYAMLYFIAATQMKVSGVFHMYPTLPWILSSLLIHLSSPLHSPQLPLTYLFTPIKLEATAPGMHILPAAWCQTCHGTLLSKCRTGVSALWLLILYLNFHERTVFETFFLEQVGKTPGTRNGSCRACWYMQHPDTSCWAKKLKFWVSWKFFSMFCTTPKYKIQLHFLYEEYYFQVMILPKM